MGAGSRGCNCVPADIASPSKSHSVLPQGRLRECTLRRCFASQPKAGELNLGKPQGGTMQTYLDALTKNFFLSRGPHRRMKKTCSPRQIHCCREYLPGRSRFPGYSALYCRSAASSCAAAANLVGRTWYSQKIPASAGSCKRHKSSRTYFSIHIEKAVPIPVPLKTTPYARIA